MNWYGRGFRPFTPPPPSWPNPRFYGDQKTPSLVHERYTTKICSKSIRKRRICVEDCFEFRRRSWVYDFGIFFCCFLLSLDWLWNYLERIFYFDRQLQKSIYPIFRIFFFIFPYFMSNYLIFPPSRKVQILTRLFAKAPCPRKHAGAKCFGWSHQRSS